MVTHWRSRLVLLFVALFLFSTFPFPLSAFAQSGFNDDRVMLQGFYWESHRRGHPEKFPNFVNESWYDIVRGNAAKIREARFDLIWLPPPCWAGENSAGYNPKQYFRLSNDYGNNQQHRAMLETLLRNGVEPIADIVINHRAGIRDWADFENPAWGLSSICQDDEAFTRDGSPLKDTPLNQRGQPEESALPYGVGYGSGRDYAYGDFRDLDHTNPQVRRDILRFLLELKSLGYRGWRYDMVHGFHARWVALYNKRTSPTFSVGEYDWSRQSEQRGWSWYTATIPGDLKTSSDVFDFQTQFTLKDNKKNYRAWYGFGNGTGLMGDTTDGIAWKQRAVTFLENHDTGYRTNDDGTAQQDHQFDSFAKGREVEQAYAYILTHPGVPCVYWKHYFEWGEDLQNKIRALINARKVTGVHSGSALHPQNNAQAKGIYAAMIEGTKGRLYVRIGGSDTDWQPASSGYNGYREYAQGDGWKVWASLPGNPAFQQAPLKPAFPVPAFRPINQISVPDSWLN